MRLVRVKPTPSGSWPRLACPSCALGARKGAVRVEEAGVASHRLPGSGSSTPRAATPARAGLLLQGAFWSALAVTDWLLRLAGLAAGLLVVRGVLAAVEWVAWSLVRPRRSVWPPSGRNRRGR